jgi:hypothetical protein
MRLNGLIPIRADSNAPPALSTYSEIFNFQSVKDLPVCIYIEL